MASQHLTRVADAVDAAVTSRRRAVLLVTAITLVAAAYVAFFVSTRPPAESDPAFFEHAGWTVTRGAVPYVDFWDVKPPLVFGVAALLSLVAGGNVVVLHALSGLASGLAVVGTVVALGDVAYLLTGSDVASVTAGLVFLVPAEVYGLVPYGLRPKYFATFFGVVALYCALIDRPATAGVAAAASAAFWQPGVTFLVLGAGVVAQRGGRTALLRLIGGAALVACLVVLPFLGWGALVPLFVETAIAPLSGGEPVRLLGRLASVALALGYGTVLLPPAIAGLRRGLSAAPDRTWWVGLGALVFAGQVFFVDMEGVLDMLPWLVFLALGVGLFLRTQPPSRRRAALAGVAVLILAGPVWHLAPRAPLKPALVGLHQQLSAHAATVRAPSGARVPDVRTIFWEKRRPRTCHYRLSEKELRWMRATGGRLSETRCGSWPFGDPVSRLSNAGWLGS